MDNPVLKNMCAWKLIPPNFYPQMALNDNKLECQEQMIAANKTFRYQSKMEAPFFSYQWYLEKAQAEHNLDPVT